MQGSRMDGYDKEIVDQLKQLLQAQNKTNQLLEQLLSNAMNNVDFLSKYAAERGIQAKLGDLNQAYLKPSVGLIREGIQKILQANGAETLIVDFDNVSSFEQNSHYHIFSQDEHGCCMMVRDPANSAQWFAFPYPNTSTWFIMGRQRMEALYEIQGGTGDYAPQISILKPAITIFTDKRNSNGKALFERLEKGKMVAISK